jgi:hypothetical protein
MTSPAELRHDLLLSEYLACFEKFGELSEYSWMDPVVGALAVREPDENGRVTWRPRRIEPDPALLDALHAKIPARFSPLFERLLLAFRWAEISLDRYSLIGNPPGPGLDGFFRKISGDPGLWDTLVPGGFLRFGKGPEGDYDPVCFDINSRKKSREMRVVKIDHEEILCNYRIKIVAELAPSFEAV